MEYRIIICDVILDALFHFVLRDSSSFSYSDYLLLSPVSEMRHRISIPIGFLLPLLLLLYLSPLTLVVSSSSTPLSSSPTATATATATASSSSHYGHDEDHQSCPIFVWDIPSYLRYHACRRLVRDQLFEGIGGRKVSTVHTFPKGQLYSLSLSFSNES